MSTLELTLVDWGSRLDVELAFSSGGRLGSQASTLLSIYTTVLRELDPRAPGTAKSTGLMTDAEEQRMRKLLSGERRERPSTTLAAMLERCADERPGALALWDDEESWTFGELDALSNGIARQLLEHGAGDNRVVAVFMPRSAATIACFLGVLKAGSAFVPIDSNAPPERVRQILDLASPHLLLVHPDMHVPGLQLPTLEADRARLDSWKTVERPPRSGSPESLAYVIFTSGSTGQPKGAMIEQRSLVNLIGSLDELIYAGEPRGLRVGLNAPF